MYCPQLIAGGKWSWSAKEVHANACISGDFYPVEGDGAWSAGRNGIIDIPIGGDLGGFAEITGEIVFSFFRGIVEFTPAVMLYVNGQASTAVLHLDGDEPFHRLQFTAMAPTGSICQLRLESSHAASPEERGFGDDPRRIGLILHSIDLSAQSASTHGGHDRLQIWGIGDQPLDVPRIEE